MDYEAARAKLIQHLRNEIRDERVLKAMSLIPRELFVPSKEKKLAYEDRPLPIGFGQTISAPHMVAIMCEALDIKKGQKILEIGAGSGYHAAVVSSLVGDEGHIYTIERIEELGKFAEKNLKKEGFKNTTIIIGDGSEGMKKFQPYDRIYVTCASPRLP